MPDYYFIFECDPGHGWLLVTLPQLTELGLKESDITPFSYVSPTGVIALEEDCDAKTFLNAWSKKTGRAPRFDERCVKATEIRNWKPFGSKSSPKRRTKETAHA